jgi:hypothetical protein
MICSYPYGVGGKGDGLFVGGGGAGFFVAGGGSVAFCSSFLVALGFIPDPVELSVVVLVGLIVGVCVGDGE